MDGDRPQRPIQFGAQAATGNLARVARPARATPSVAPTHSNPIEAEAQWLAAMLLDQGILSQSQITEIMAALRGQSLSFGQIAQARGMLAERDLLSALSEFYGYGTADLTAAAPDAEVARLLPVGRALSAEAVIWRRAGRALVVATSRPDQAEVLRAALPEKTRVIFVLAPRDQILAAQNALYGIALAREAEGRAPSMHSCRGWQNETMGHIVLAVSLGLVTLLALAPSILAAVIFGAAILIYIANAALKFGAFATTLRANTNDAPPPVATPLRLPTVTILVPLFQEPEVAGALVDRLRKIDYPRERLDVILAVEESDPTTLNALRKGTLPPWMRAIIVPHGHPQTKPRALNYALNFARGEIVGIYDAEDRPDPDQIHKIVQGFADAPADVACLQGRLDYYNARHNWMAGLFTVEYAAWFRVLLPGVEKMGLVVPLGGTTLFMRRKILEEVGAWDAHNVTEDAELGLRLARAGYVTQLVDTTTYEEANAAALPWIRQRSRWLKGYLMTWGAAMRRPRALLAELGAWRFAWVQVQFLGAVAGFLLAPLLWSLMVKPFGFWHPLDAVLSPFAYGILATLMVAGLLGSITISIYATRAPHLRHLRPMTPLVEPYYLFGTFAAWLGAFEMIVRPFFWAKTEHGKFGGAETAPALDDQAPAAASSRNRT
ncbi:glycosyltransferase [Gymnodinialimonas sp. 2305UL16-5]|uniref:glycosyltransferase family 2 protein n=1 Tax=Gymnodinialimonas mytili TaxID=3126503 RepID=UPI0030A265FF